METANGGYFDILLVGGIEFYCSQVPYSMKGLLLGSVYGMAFIIVGLFQLLVIPFSIKSVIWGVGTLSCEFWHQLTLYTITPLGSTDHICVDSKVVQEKKERGCSYYRMNTSLQKGIILVNKLTEKQHCINIIIIESVDSISRDGPDVTYT